METGYLTDFGLADIGGYYRFMFSFAGRFRAAKKAHRVFVFSLGKCPAFAVFKIFTLYFEDTTGIDIVVSF